MIPSQLLRSRVTVATAASALLLSPLALTLSTPRVATAASGAAKAADPDAVTGTWGIDKPHSSVGFAITHLVVSKVRGRFGDFDGTVKADAKSPANSSVDFTIKTASIDTGQPQRDGHLKSPDFFDADKYPDITFKSTKVVKHGNKYDALGTLTLHGVSKSVVLPFTLAGPVKGPDGALHLGVETGITISRADYGLTWNKMVEGSSMVGDDVDIAINLDLVKKPSAP